MNSLLSLTILITISSLSTTSHGLNIATFNLALGGTKYTRHGPKRYVEYPDRTTWSNLYDMAGVIVRYDIDIIGLQELDVNTGRIKHYTTDNEDVKDDDVQIDDPQQIVNELRNNFHQDYMARFITVESNPFGENGKYGNALVFKVNRFKNSVDTTKIQRNTFEESGREQRGYIAKKFIFTDDRNTNYNFQLWYVTTHLDTLKTAKLQLEELMEIVDTFSYPTIVCGDFNMNYRSVEVKNYLDDVFQEYGFDNIVDAQDSNTFARSQRDGKLDYCLYNDKGKEWFIINNARYISPNNGNGKWFTDHWGILLSVDIHPNIISSN